MAESNPYTDKSQAKQFFLKNYLIALGKILKEISYYFLLALRAIGSLIMEALGKR